MFTTTDASCSLPSTATGMLPHHTTLHFGALGMQGWASGQMPLIFAPLWRLGQEGGQASGGYGSTATSAHVTPLDLPQGMTLAYHNVADEDQWILLLIDRMQDFSNKDQNNRAGKVLKPCIPSTVSTTCHVPAYYWLMNQSPVPTLARITWWQVCLFWPWKFLWTKLISACPAQHRIAPSSLGICPAQEELKWMWAAYNHAESLFSSLSLEWG